MKTLKEWMTCVRVRETQADLSPSALALLCLLAEDSTFPNVIPDSVGLRAVRDYLKELKASEDAMTVFNEICQAYAAKSGWFQYRDFKKVD